MHEVEGFNPLFYQKLKASFLINTRVFVCVFLILIMVILFY